MIRAILKKGINPPVQFVKRCKAKKILNEIMSDDDPSLKLIGIALQESLLHVLTIQEKEKEIIAES